MSLRGMVDDDLFETKDRQLRERIERIKEVSKDAQERNKNWYEVIGKTLETLRSPKEKNGSGRNSGRTQGDITSHRTCSEAGRAQSRYV